MVRLKKCSNILINIRTFERAMGNRGNDSKLINHYRISYDTLMAQYNTRGEKMMSGTSKDFTLSNI